LVKPNTQVVFTPVAYPANKPMGFWKQVILKFLEGPHNTVIVNVEDLNEDVVRSGLYAAIYRDFSTKAKVSTTNHVIYLTKLP
jgi:hypothetical protein